MADRDSNEASKALKNAYKDISLSIGKQLDNKLSVIP
jgi:hypothetical protein